MKIYEIIIFGLWGIWRSHLPPVQSGRTGLSEEGVFPLRKIKQEKAGESRRKQEKAGEIQPVLTGKRCSHLKNIFSLFFIFWTSFSSISNLDSSSCISFLVKKSAFEVAS